MPKQTKPQPDHPISMLHLRRPVDPPLVTQLVESALARIQSDDTIVYAAGTGDERRMFCYPPAPTAEWDNTTWADQALRIADVLYHQMGPAFEPDYVLANLARYLAAYRHDRLLLAAALSLLCEPSGALHPPQSALKGDWRSRLLCWRTPGAARATAGH